jgi:hypothetical protein
MAQSAGDYRDPGVRQPSGLQRLAAAGHHRLAQQSASGGHHRHATAHGRQKMGALAHAGACGHRRRIVYRQT